jgi:glycine cleavage system transcriptional repressor
MGDGKAVVSILGEDRPGIVHAVSRALFQAECNILEVSQTILSTEFAGIFLVVMPQGLNHADLLSRLKEEVDPMHLTAGVKEFKPPADLTVVQSEPFVITLRGRDRLGIIPEFTGVIAGFDVNIENLKAITQEDEDQGVVIAFEVAVPKTVHRPAFREALRHKAEELELELSVQHRDIFEAIHRI